MLDPQRPGSQRPTDALLLARILLGPDRLGLGQPDQSISTLALLEILRLGNAAHAMQYPTPAGTPGLHRHHVH